MTNFKLILKLCKTNLFITDTHFAEMHYEIFYDCIHDKKLSQDEPLTFSQLKGN